MDYRKEWFRHRILSYFEENQLDLFDIFLNNDNNSVLNQLNSYLDDETDTAVNINTQVLIVYKTYYSKIVHEEIEVQEEGKQLNFVHLYIFFLFVFRYLEFLLIWVKLFQ